MLQRCGSVAQRSDRKLKADELREWNLQLKKYEDSQANKRSMIKACRDVGMAWANNQPQSIVKTSSVDGGNIYTR